MSARRGSWAFTLLAAAFLLAYFAARRLGLAPVLCELMAAVPAGFAAVALIRASRREQGTSRRFLLLLGVSAGAWVGGQGAWTLALALGLRPDEQENVWVIGLLFIGFTVPALAAALLRPRPLAFRPGLHEALNALLLIGAVALAFLRLVLVPLAGSTGPPPFQSVLLACLCFSLAALSLAHVALGADAVWRRRHGLLALFAVTYGVGSALANGFGDMPPPGSLLDLAWFVPFFLLAAVAGAEQRPQAPLDASSVIWTVGAVPLAIELAALLIWPASVDPTGRALLVAGTFLLGLGAAARLKLEDAPDALRRLGEGGWLEEERRSGRLESLASVARPLLTDLRRAVDVLGSRAAAAETALGDEAASVGEQVQRALVLTAEIEGALGRSPPSERKELDVAHLVEEVLQAEVNGGLPLRARVETAASDLPRVAADAEGLAAAVRELARNAAQASPGGRLVVQVESEGAFVRLRFADDGPGIPEEIRGHVFDPFFTTRRVGEGVGLGLTLVHFVSREALGSVRVEPAEGRGTSVVMRLPAVERKESWAAARLLAVPALLTAGLLTVVAVDSRYSASLTRGATVVVSGLACLELARAASAGPALFGLLALGAALPGLAALFQLPGLGALADWPWVVAVFLAAGPAALGSPRRRSLGGMALAIFLLVHFGMVVRVFVQGAASAALAAVAGGFLRLVLASAAAAVAARTPQASLRRGLEGLALSLTLWSIGEVAGLWLRQILPLFGVPLTELAAILPLLVLAALGRVGAERPLSAAAPGR